MFEDTLRFTAGPLAPFAVGDRVTSEYGAGTVEKFTSRVLVYRLDSGELINVVVGTPGYHRVTREEG
jgi:hypothetical protein